MRKFIIRYHSLHPVSVLICFYFTCFVFLIVIAVVSLFLVKFGWNWCRSQSCIYKFLVLQKQEPQRGKVYVRKNLTSSWETWQPERLWTELLDAKENQWCVHPKDNGLHKYQLLRTAASVECIRSGEFFQIFDQEPKHVGTKVLHSSSGAVLDRSVIAFLLGIGEILTRSWLFVLCVGTKAAWRVAFWCFFIKDVPLCEMSVLYLAAKPFLIHIYCSLFCDACVCEGNNLCKLKH